ncbi:hypothetical protein L1987_47012 [Smallanthus sonchifolius]|uniref:Uncharacterized protein n=1 Tax=Smallanthus sonchifolius TaxID=185202 RepID=A0ACB9G2C4_9ASTR|nr:hypothetical protein L1987_47012 [Smallanthus sonchifolius]
MKTEADLDHAFNSERPRGTTEKANSDSESALEAEIDESDVAYWSPDGEKVASGGSSVDGSELLFSGCCGHFCKATKVQIIRLITYSISGLAYLKFMGNEFGHPKWVESPMASNGFSFSLAKRDCDLLAREGVHQNLLSFDKLHRP